MNKLLITILIFSQVALAEDAVLLNKEQPAPYSGYLLPKEKIIEFRNNDIDLIYTKKENLNLKLQVGDYEKRVELYRKDNDNLAERLQKSNTGFFEKLGFFMLGTFVTFGICYGVYRTK